MRKLVKLVLIVAAVIFVLDNLSGRTILIGVGLFFLVGLLVRGYVGAQLGGAPPRRFGDG